MQFMPPAEACIEKSCNDAEIRCHVVKNENCCCKCTSVGNRIS